MVSDTITHTDHDPRVLVAAALSGDSDAWREVFRRYNGLVVATIRSFRLQGVDAEDTAQNTWLKLLENLSGIRRPEQIAAWLVTTTRRECLATLRRTRREIPADQVRATLPDQAPGPEGDVVARAILQDMVAALAELPRSRKALLTVLFLEPVDGYAEVSKRTGLPIGSIGPTRAPDLPQ